MNIFAFLQQKLSQKPQVVTQQQAKAAMGSKEQAEMLSKFGVVQDDLRAALASNDLINFERCLAGDTRIKLLDNTTPTIREMAEHPELYIGRYVVSINPTSLDLEPDKIVGVKQTVKNAELVRVTLDDDHYVDCTLDHRFLLRDGTYREAQYLQPLDSLMPFYVRFTEGKNPLHQYLQAYRPGLNRWIYLHRLVPAFFGAILGKGITVHHKNFKKEDNDPSNLQVMTTPEHRALHALLARKRPEGIKVCPICKEEFVTTLYLENPELEFIYCGRECWAKSKEKDLVTLICEVCERPFETTCSAASYRKTCSVKCASVAKSTDETLRAIEEKPFTTCPICKKEFPTTAQLLTYCSQKCYWESKKGKAPWNKGLKAESDERVARARDRSLATKVRRREEARVLLNHKVLKVERLSKREDTYDLQTERNHNFPLAIGVFVHNSSLYTSIDRCFTGDTKVALLDGRDVSMLDLIKEYESGKVNYVYSVDLENKKIVRSPIAWAGKTGTLPIMEVVLDNDEAIRCTLDHKFMLRDGTYKRAKDLAPGESLMPLYRKIQEKGRYSEGRYFLYDPFSTHTKVQYLYFNPPYPNRPKHSVVHHAFANYHEFDRNILDDTPENHQIITKAEHTEIHRKLCRKGGENWVIRLKTENYEKYLEWCKKIGITRKANHVQSYNKGLTKENCESLKHASEKLTGTKRPEEVKRKYLVSLIQRNNNCTREEAEERYELVRAGVSCPICGGKMHPDRKTCSYECKNKMQSIVKKGKRFNYLPPWNKGLTKETDERLAKVSENWGRKAEGVLKNHKVKSIKFLNEIEDVYDITVYPNHNFALTAGVFVSNSLVHPLMASAPSLFAEVATAYNRIQNATVWVTAKSKEYQYQIEKLLEIINIEEEIYDLAWSTATFGDLFWNVLAEPGLGVVSINSDAHPINYCLRGDTKIRLFDDSTPTIKEMFDDREKYIGNDIYCCSESGGIRATQVKDVLKTRLNATYVRVHLDSGEFFDVTPDHKCMLRTGKFKEARDLQPFESLMPLYSKGVLLNHKVVRVEYLDIVEDAYDLTVMGVNPTFPLACGVFVHNSRVDYNGRCLKGDTKIELLDNTAPTIQEMAESPEKYIGKYVLSINPNTLTLEPDKIVNIFKTKRDAKLMRITLDNGEFVDCTADHRFLLRDGTYKEAKDLVEGQSLMPYYTKISTDPNFEGYKLAYNPKTQTYRHVHQLVSYFINGKTPKGFVIHHRLVEGGPNKLNNDPAFLQVITKQEHSRLHQEYRSLTHKEDCGCVFCKQERGECKGENSYLYGTKQSEEHILNRILSRQSHPLDCTCGSCVFNHSEDCTCLTCCSKRGERFGHKEGCMCYNCVYLRNGGQEVTRVCEYCHTSFTCRNTQPQFLCSDACQDAWQKGRKYIFNPITGEILYIVGEQLDRYVREGWKLGRGKTTTMRGRKWILNRSLNKSIRVSNEQVPEYLEQGWEYGRLAPWLKPQVINHKVFKIEYLTEVADVYDLTTERNHNFPLKAGVFVHNCIGFYSTPGGYNTSAERNLLPPWDLVHFRLLGAKRRRPQYGGADSNYCITGDTRIHLLDGTSPTVKEMSEGGYVGKAIWSVNLETGRQEEDEIVEVKKTRLNAELVRVTLSNGKFIECTPDHKFLLRSKIYVEAQNLTEGEQLRAYDSKGNSWVAFRSSVRKVEKLEKREDTYDLEIKKNHNFPTAAGVFISNSEFRTVSIMAPDVRRLTSKYGTSVLSDALPIFKRLRLAEDSILMARITRGVLRNVWKIGISKENGNNEAVNSIIDGYISTLKEARSLSIDVNNPSYNSKFNAMANIEDIIIPVWGEVNQVMVDKIGGEVDIKWLEDVDLLTKQLSTALAVPLPLLAGYAEAANGGIGQNSLEKLDIRFARQARRIQRAVIVGLTRLAQIHLAWQGINPDTKLFQIHMSETSTAEELEIQDALDKGLDVTGKMLEMLEAVLGPDLDKEAALEYLSEKFLKLGDLELDKLKLKGNPNAFNVSKGEDTLGGLGAAPASDSSSNPFLSHAPSGESTGGETPAPSTAPEGESEVKEEPAEEEKNPFKENLSISDLRSMVPLKESRDKWDAQWGHIRVKIIKKD